MLITAGHFWLHAPHRFNPGGNGLAYLGGDATNRLGDSRFNNGAAFGKLAAIPQGSNGQKSWVLPRKAGGMSSHNETQGTTIASLAMAKGWNLSGLAEGTTPTAEATLQLVVSMVASALGEATTNANLNAALGMAGSAAGIATDSAVINALAWAIGHAEGEAVATLLSYATGELKGSVSPFTELSPENLAAAVWNSLLVQYQETGSAGKALASASSGGVDLDLMAQAVWEHATRTLTESAGGMTVSQFLALKNL